MRISKLFTIPEGEKVTEQKLRSVLVASICSILLCMTCLASTTWAWFTVSVENTNNVIQINIPWAFLYINGEDFKSGSTLPENETTFIVNHANDWDDFTKKSTLYVSFFVDDTVVGYVVLDQSNGYSTEIKSEVTGEHTLSWTASWFAPSNAKPLPDNKITLLSKENIEAELPSKGPSKDEGSGQNPSEETTEPAETTTPSDPSEGATQPTDPADSTDPTKATDPADSTDPTKATDPTDPTDPTKPTEPTEPETPTNPTQPTEPTPTTEPTQPTVALDSNESEKPAGEEPSGEA